MQGCPVAYKRPHLKGAIGQGPLLWAIWKRGLGGKEVGERRRGLKRRKRSPWNKHQNEGINSDHIWIASAEYLCNIWKNALEFKGPLLSFQLPPPNFSSLFSMSCFLASSKSAIKARKYSCSNVGWALADFIARPNWAHVTAPPCAGLG